MLYRQRETNLYNPNVFRMSMGNVDFSVNYIEILDESCVELHHFHNGCYEIYYCLEGPHQLVVEEAPISLNAGEFLIIAPGVQHHTVYKPHIHKRYCVFVFTEPTLSSVRGRGKHRLAEADYPFTTLTYFEENGYYHGLDQFDAKEILNRLESELSEKLPGKESMISALYQQFLIAVLRSLPQTNGIGPQTPSTINLTIAITKYMHANYQKNISVEDISREFFISPRHVSRVFEEFFGSSFKRTLNYYRVNYAKNYFLDTDLSVEKIAGLVGLSSARSLYQLFKECEGMTVAEYRASIAREKSGQTDSSSKKTDAGA